MEFTNEVLCKMIDMEAVGDFYPYNSGSSDEIESYLKSVVSVLSESKLIKVEADFEHYGSGYASYVDVFCYRKDGSSTEILDGSYCITGISLYLCRLAPIAVFGLGEISRNDKGAEYHSCLHTKIEKLNFTSGWEDVIDEIIRKMEQFGLEIVEKDLLIKPLPFHAEISTLFNSYGQYRILDALFYWAD